MQMIPQKSVSLHLVAHQLGLCTASSLASSSADSHWDAYVETVEEFVKHSNKSQCLCCVNAVIETESYCNGLTNL